MHFLGIYAKTVNPRLFLNNFKQRFEEHLKHFFFPCSKPKPGWDFNATGEKYYHGPVEQYLNVKIVRISYFLIWFLKPI